MFWWIYSEDRAEIEENPETFYYVIAIRDSSSKKKNFAKGAVCRIFFVQTAVDILYEDQYTGGALNLMITNLNIINSIVEMLIKIMLLR